MAALTTVEDLPDAEDEEEEHEHEAPCSTSMGAGKPHLHQFPSETTYSKQGATAARMPEMRPTTPITDVKRIETQFILRRKPDLDHVWKTFVVAAESDMPCVLYTVTCCESFGGVGSIVKIGFKTALNADRFLEGKDAIFFNIDPTDTKKKVIWVNKDEKTMVLQNHEDCSHPAVRDTTKTQQNIPEHMLKEDVKFYPCVVGHCEFHVNPEIPLNEKDKKDVAKKRKTWVVGVFEEESIKYRNEFGNNVASERDFCKWMRASWWSNPDACPSRPPSVWVYWQLVMQWPYDPLFVDLWGSQFSEGNERGSYENMAKIFRSKLTRPNSKLESAKVKAFIPKELELALEKKAVIPPSWKIKYRQQKIISSDSSSSSSSSTSSSEDESRRGGKQHHRSGKRNSRKAKNASKSKAAKGTENQRSKRTGGRSRSRRNAGSSRPRMGRQSAPRDRHDSYGSRCNLPPGTRVVLDDSPRGAVSPRERGRRARSPLYGAPPERSYSDDRMGEFYYESRRGYGPGTNDIFEYGPRHQDDSLYDSRGCGRRLGPYYYRSSR